jgi:hypothetical protein
MGKFTRADGVWAGWLHDLSGNFYALDAATGQKLWGQKMGGAIGGGVITYIANGAESRGGDRLRFPRCANRNSESANHYPGSRGQRDQALITTGATRATRAPDALRPGKLEPGHAAAARGCP